MPGWSRSRSASIGKKPNTNVALTKLGRKRIVDHWERLERLKAQGAE